MKTQEVSEKVVDSCLPALKFVPNWFDTNILFVSNQSGTNFNDDRQVSTTLSDTSWVLYWSAWNAWKTKFLEKPDDVVISNDDIIIVNKDSDNVTFFSNDIGLVNVDLNNVRLDDVSFDNDGPEIIIHARFNAWYNR